MEDNNSVLAVGPISPTQDAFRFADILGMFGPESLFFETLLPSRGITK